MKIAVLGTGIVGQTIAGRLSGLGHEVVMGSRDSGQAMASDKPNMAGTTLRQWHEQNQGISVVNFNEAARAGELIINATNGMGSMEALRMAGAENLRGKVVLDISNPLDFSKGMPPSLFVCNTDSLGEQLQREFPEARFVKGLNTMNCFIMVNPSLVPGDHNVFICGNEDSAKKSVAELLNSFGWKKGNIIDMGDMSFARGVEQLLPIWIGLFGKYQHANFNFHIAMGDAPKM